MLFIIGRSASGALVGWNTNAWPCGPTAHLRLPAPLCTNLSGREDRANLLLRSSTNHYPAVVVPLFHGFPASTNGTNSITIKYFTDLFAPTDSVFFSNSALTTPTTNNATGIVFFVEGLATQYVSWTRGLTNFYVAQTNMCLNVREVRAFDAYRAISERYEAALAVGTIQVGLTNIGDYDASAPSKPHFYRGERDMLVETKDWIGENLKFFTDLNPVFPYFDGSVKFQSTTDTSDETSNTLTRYDTVTEGLITFIDSTAIVPTNWFDFTPWRALDGAGYQETGDVVWVRGYTNVVIIDDCPDANPCYDYEYNPCLGTSFGYFGTNGQQFSDSCVFTNHYTSEVASGYSAADYGWQHVPAVLNYMIWTHRQATRAAITNGDNASFVLGTYTVGCDTNVPDPCFPGWPDCSQTVHDDYAELQSYYECVGPGSELWTPLDRSETAFESALIVVRGTNGAIEQYYIAKSQGENAAYARTDVARLQPAVDCYGRFFGSAVSLGDTSAYTVACTTWAKPPATVGLDEVPIVGTRGTNFVFFQSFTKPSGAAASTNIVAVPLTGAEWVPASTNVDCDPLVSIGFNLDKVIMVSRYNISNAFQYYGN